MSSSSNGGIDTEKNKTKAKSDNNPLEDKITQELMEKRDTNSHLLSRSEHRNTNDSSEHHANPSSLEARGATTWLSSSRGAARCAGRGI